MAQGRAAKNLVEDLNEGVAIRLIRNELQRWERQRAGTGLRLAALDRDRTAGDDRWLMPFFLSNYKQAVSRAR